MEKLIINEDFIFLIIMALLFTVMLYLIKKSNKKNINNLQIEQKEFSNKENNTNLNEYEIPQHVKDRFKEDYPNYFNHYLLITEKEKFQFIENNLKKHFHSLANYQLEEKPLKEIEDFLNIFILFKKDYKEFCEKSFGKIIDYKQNLSENKFNLFATSNIKDRSRIFT